MPIMSKQVLKGNQIHMSRITFSWIPFVNCYNCILFLYMFYLFIYSFYVQNIQIQLFKPIYVTINLATYCQYELDGKFHFNMPNI